ncbi:hypothetical protein M0M57_13810 [Flavobacterium azooxidireducens]|uniref:Uncharacterized protein n=1 Tax=Flavobacterium azooxidireducens TaxID=1871076 RepID=A0ABY4KDR5_9FLAO|nr:hypothetical protein [Flavobacterium azooxidireducens]UPQ78689.1 hypothetical protein M0M57_13810 [Flavobacterium azooxidireducens]
MINDLINKQKTDFGYQFKKNWLNLSLSENVKKNIFEVLPIIKPEMYFYYTYRLIVIEEFEKKNITIERKKIYEKFLELNSKILKEKCSILLSENDKPENSTHISFTWTNVYENYSKEVELLKDSVFNLINYKKNIRENLNIDENENPYFSQKSVQFFQNIMFIGFNIAHQRILCEADNENNFGIELVELNNQDELIIYPNPILMESLTEYLELSKEDIINFCNENFEKLGISKISNERLKKDLETSYLISFKGELYYLKKYFDFDFNTYMNKRINKPIFSSLLFETQANLKKVI